VARAGAALAAALAKDESLSSNETPKDWEEEKVSDGPASDAGRVVCSFARRPLVSPVYANQ
jgi:hypothetical protein